MGLLRILLMFSLSTGVLAQENRIDQVGPEAPALSAFGPFDIGVRTLTLVNPQQVDVTNSVDGEVTNYYDRPLTVELWYPATLASGQVPGADYSTETRNVDVLATLHGRAVREAAPDRSQGAYPLVILSHGYPGNRFLMSHLGENLASKGYVVASIDHTDSTYRRQDPIASTLYNRPLDQRFVLHSIAALNQESGHFLEGLVNTENTGLIGFSMGGYGLLNNLGGAINPEAVSNSISPPNELLEDHTLRNRNYRRNLDGRFKVAIAIAPWGMNTNFFTPETLKGIETPILFVAGSVDATAGYDNGTRAIYESTVNADRYLLTFTGGGHSVAAPIPVPYEVASAPEARGVSHYSDSTWDSVKSNNILQHFASAFLDYHLKGLADRAAYFTVEADANVGGVQWPGFAPGTARDLLLEHKTKGE